ncbi:glyoxalase [Cytobacillus firmus]|uniref:VOC family protein n=1 Tax=Cytobacillus firmus TaxID=1399 RepID=UPI00077C92B2|nr:VOC family protein [Cytobacillus firmus]MBG9543162.1 glyoxalase [Cytobacillus firmus]MBG9552465.1 glyoxalase [Cytobacillus firmus]MBG9558874.1 glyoxalase [Cytobacillus firmus]MBG9575456.1 glyoxalase [Cytobacillus firmus]MEC1892952.1 VOC family protein [Cytobacillus firmus]
MIKQVGQIMLYVNNQDEAVNFWTEKAGFHVLAEEDNGQGMRWIEVSPSKEAETSIILDNKKWVAKLSPGLSLGTPSLMFFTEDLERLYSDFSNKGITVGEIVDMPSGRVFNFADGEENYFMEARHQNVS